MGAVCYNSGQRFAFRMPKSSPPLPVVPIISCAIDDIAMTALQQRSQQTMRCHLCENSIEGEPAATGLFMWTRGSETRLEEPPLCPGCAAAIDMTAVARWRFGHFG